MIEDDLDDAGSIARENVQDSFEMKPETENSPIDRRTGPRYSLLAVVDLSGTSEVMCIDGRLREISRKGCYVNTPSTLPEGSALKIVISREDDDDTFTTNGKVIYVHDQIGMGLVFTDTPEEQLEVLNSWLAGLGTELP